MSEENKAEALSEENETQALSEENETKALSYVTKKKFRVKNPIYGQLVIGPPGSGKTTYCHHAQKFYTELGRKVAVVNLDPANENMEYTSSIDIMKLIKVQECMSHLRLGPNGSLMFCAEYLELHFDDWFLPEIRKCIATSNYFIFDCPGQVELYTHHGSMSRIFKALEVVDFHLCTVNLIDSHYCSEPTKFVSALLLTLNMMLRMALPHVNVLSKADMLRKFKDKLDFNVEFYTDVLDLKYLLEAIDNTPTMKKYHKLNAAICSMVEDYALVSFQLLNPWNTDSMLRLRKVIDKANGYIFQAGEEHAVNSMLSCAVSAETETERQKADFDPYVL